MDVILRLFCAFRNAMDLPSIFPFLETPFKTNRNRQEARNEKELRSDSKENVQNVMFWTMHNNVSKRFTENRF